MKKLSLIQPELEKIVVDMTEDANALVVEGAYDEALAIYDNAWELLPHPKTEWEMLSNWIAISFFDAHLKAGQLQEAKKWAEIELETRASDDDYGPLMDLGIVNFELKDFAAALQWFKQAFASGGLRAFKEYPKKYLDFLQRG